MNSTNDSKVTNEDPLSIDHFCQLVSMAPNFGMSLQQARKSMNQDAQLPESEQQSTVPDV